MSGRVGRPSLRRSLALWANGERVGTWTTGGPSGDELRYAESWRASVHARPISLSLPLTLDDAPLRGPAVAAYFDNLLPDTRTLRERIRQRFDTASSESFDLLGAVGRDCVGALQLLREDEAPADITRTAATPLDEAAIARVLRASRAGSPFVDEREEFRISLAGAQEKTALTWHRGRFARPRGVTPTTHIFKLPLGLVGPSALDLRTSIENEWLCGRLLEAFGLPVASATLATFEDLRALIVERFDRRRHPQGGHWLRLPQEDFCQALGLPSERKYEEHGGPSIPDIARVLHGSDEARDDLSTFLRAQLLFWMLAAIDGHAKNFSLHLLPQGRYRLTPLYDVVSAWPLIGRRHDQLAEQKLKLAMAQRGSRKHYRIAQIHRDHFVATATACGYPRAFDEEIDEVVARVPSAIAAAATSLPAGFPPAVFEAITAGLSRMAEKLAAARAR